MFKKFTVPDILMLVSAFLSLIFSEILWFQGDKEAGIFIGLWVPSILGFAILLKLIQNQKNDWYHPILCSSHYITFLVGIPADSSQCKIQQVVETSSLIDLPSLNNRFFIRPCLLCCWNFSGCINKMIWWQIGILPVLLHDSLAFQLSVTYESRWL